MASATRTVLLLEDDQLVRSILRDILEGAEYTVLETTNIAEAIDVCRTHAGPIGLMIADVVLRGTHGPEAVQRVRELRPGLSVLFISGYPLDQLEHRGLIDPDKIAAGEVAFLQKPFNLHRLLTAVHSLEG